MIFMEENVDEVKQKIEDINKQIEESFKHLNNSIIKKIEKSENEIKECLKRKKKFYLKMPIYRETPRPHLTEKNDKEINHMISPILFCLSNLEFIAELALGEEYKDIFEKFPDKEHFYVHFIKLMKEMRNKSKDENQSNYSIIDDYLKKKMDYYMSQDPAVIIRYILKKLEDGVDLYNKTQGNQNKNIIANNFLVTYKIYPKCYNCDLPLSNKGTRENKYFTDIHLRKPDADVSEELRDIFGNLLPGKEPTILKETCVNCGKKLKNAYVLEDLKKYLIINLNRDGDPENKMKLSFEKPLELNEKNKVYKYELIIALVDVNTNTKNLDDIKINEINEKNKSNFKIYFKNFINDRCYQLSIPKDIEQRNVTNIEKIISEHKPNILIYKRI